MNYTEEEIDRYIEILKSVDKSTSQQSNKVSCKYCHCSDFFIHSGYYNCSNCYFSLGHVLLIMTNLNMEDFTFDKNLSIKESITI